MAQPKIQQHQANVTGGSGFTSYASYTKSADQVVAQTAVAIVFDVVIFDSGGWQTTGTNFTVPSGVSKVKVEAYYRFVRQDGTAIATSSTMLGYVVINGTLWGISSTNGTGTTDSRAHVVTCATPWVPVTAGQVIRGFTEHNISATTVIRSAWLNIEALA